MLSADIQLEADTVPVARPLLEADAVSFRYGRTRPWIFCDVTMSIDAGEVFTILGPNARGKTTLLKCLAGLHAPAVGTVTASGGVGYVPQSHQSVFSFDVLDVVLMGRARRVKVYSSPTRDDRDAALAVLDRVGIGALAHRDFGALSGGERQMVLIARALVSGCDTLILDEPASALDLANQARILSVLRSLADDGMAIIMTTHHPDHALHIAERSMLMVDPDRRLIGETRDLLSGDRLTSMYGVEIVTADVSTPSALRRLTVPDFGRGVA